MENFNILIGFSIILLLHLSMIEAIPVNNTADRDPELAEEKAQEGEKLCEDGPCDWIAYSYRFNEQSHRIEVHDFKIQQMCTLDRNRCCNTTQLLMKENDSKTCVCYCPYSTNIHDSFNEWLVNKFIEHSKQLANTSTNSSTLRTSIN